MNGTWWPDPSTVTTLGWTLMHFLWQGAAAASILAVANALLPGSPRARYVAGLMTLLAMLALPVSTFVVLRPAGATATAPDSETLAPSAVQAEPPTFLLHSQRADEMLSTLVILWAAGVLAFSARALGGCAVLWRLRRSARTVPWLATRVAELCRRMRLWRPVRACESTLVEVPTAVGWLRPLVLLPPATLLGLSPAQLELVLAHELAHIRRLDHVVALLQALAETLLFYHPLVWWVSHRLRVDREECCDDTAVAACGDPLGYARTLAALESLRPCAPRPALALSGGSLADRVRRLVVAPSGQASALRPWPVGLLVLLFGTLAVVAPAALPGGAAASRGLEEERFTFEDLERLAQVGVTPDYVEEMAKLGYAALSAEQLVELRTSGVTPDFVRGLADQGLSRLSASSLVQLRIHGVTPGYVRGLKEAGGPSTSALELIALRTHGVQPDDVAELRALGMAGLTRSRLIALRTTGVTVDYVRRLRELGYAGLSVPALIALRTHGVMPEYVRELQALGLEGLVAGALVELRTHGVTPDYVRALQKAGMSGLPVEELIRLRTSGFRPEGWERAGAQPREKP